MSISFYLVAIPMLIVTGLSCTSIQQTRNPVVQNDTNLHKRAPIDRLDKLKLAKSLGVFRPVENVGFEQVSFNDCSIPRSFRKSSQCSTQYLALINFRMRCRDSEGTVEQQVSSYELEPLQSDRVKWEVGKHSGWTRTDPRGYGRAIIRSWYPMDKKQFRLHVNGQIMGVSAKQVRQFVLPNYWCK